MDASGDDLDVLHDLSTPETVAKISPESRGTEWLIKAFSLGDGGTV